MSEKANYAIDIDQVSKTFRSGMFSPRCVCALKNVSLKIKTGELFGILGPNGAGKTTLLNICATLLIPENGKVSILGSPLVNAGNRSLRVLRERINMCSGSPNFPWVMTVQEILVFYAMLYGMDKKKRDKQINDCIEIMELGNFRDSRFDRLSSGTKQKLALAKALLNDPELLFLDEPTIGLDPDIAQKMRQFIQRIHREKGKTIVLTTHYMKEAEELCQRIAFIKSGEIIALGTSADLKEQTNSADLEGVFLELAN